MALLGSRIRGLGAVFRRAALILVTGQTQNLTGSLTLSGSLSHVVFKSLTGTV